MLHFPLKLWRATLENLYEMEVSGCTRRFSENNNKKTLKTKFAENRSFSILASSIGKIFCLYKIY